MDFSHSKINRYMTCPRSYKHYYLNRIVPRKRGNFFVLGEAIHKFIEVYYRSRDVELATHQVARTFDAVDRTQLNREEVHAIEVDKNIAMGIAKAYPSFYKQDFDEFKSFLTEQEFKFTFPKQTDSTTEEPRRYIGKIDALIEDHAGDWWILETKTAAPSTLNADYFNRTHIDSQVMGYMYGAKEILGKFPKGVVYNVIKKPGIRLKNGESLQAFQKRVYLEYTKFAQAKNYFQREQIIVSTLRLEEWLHEANIITGNLTYMHKGNQKTFWPMNTGACNQKFGTCEYLQACISRTYNKIMYTKSDKK